jgi:hypothetical protein
VGSYLALDFTTPGALAVMFIVTAGLNSLLRLLGPRWVLRGSELAVVYTMLVVSCVIPSMGFTAQVLPMITAPFYYPNMGEEWIKAVQGDVQSLLYVSDKSAVKLFYEGRHGKPIDWTPWIGPLTSWLIFAACFFLVMICIAVILRRQWADRERLSYPLIRLPIELTREGPGRSGPPLLRNGLFWIGFTFAFGLSSLSGLHHYFPNVPVIPLVQAITVAAGKYTFWLRISLPMLGFFYLVNLDALFGLWAFNMIFQLITMVMNITGFEWKENLGVFGTPSPLFAHLGMGAMFALVAMNGLVGREHFKKVWRCAIGQEKSCPDEGEVMSYRFAFWGMVLGLLGMGVWLAWSGMPWPLVPIFLVAAFVLFIGLTRIVVESGLAEAVASTTPSSFVTSGFGSAIIGPRGMFSLALTYVWSSDLRTSVLASATHGIQLTHETTTPGNRRGLVWAMVLALVIAIVTSFWMTFYLAYKYSGIQLNGWFFIAGPQEPYKWAQDNIIVHPSGPHIGGWLVTAVGAVIMVWLVAIRQNFAGWPLHPIGFAVGNIWMMNQLVFTTFLAWMIKLLIVRYGGLRGFKAMTPLFLGLILGQYVCNATWLLIDFICGSKGNGIFWI